MIPEETKTHIRKHYADHLHIARCPTNHDPIRFQVWPYCEGYAMGTCEVCGHVVVHPLPGFVAPTPTILPTSGQWATTPEPEPAPQVEDKPKRVRKPIEAKEADDTTPAT